MKKKLKRQVQKELRKILKAQKLSVSIPSPSPKFQKVLFANDNNTSLNNVINSKDSSGSETFKSKRSGRTRKCSCSKNFKYFKFQFKKLGKTQEAILTELQNFRNKKFVKNVHHSVENTKLEQNLEILRLPCLTVSSFVEFEKQCKESKEVAKCLLNFLKEIHECDITRYIRTCMKRILIDDVAINFTWHGFYNNIAVGGYAVIRILKIVCLSIFTNATEDDVIKHIKKWFHYAKDRVRKANQRIVS